MKYRICDKEYDEYLELNDTQDFYLMSMKECINKNMKWRLAVSKEYAESKPEKYRIEYE